MELYIADLMADYAESEFDLSGTGCVNIDRIKKLTFEKIAVPNDMPLRKKRGRGRTARMVLIAAAILVALSVTAYAVYQHALGERIMEGMPEFEDFFGNTMVYYSQVGPHTEAAAESAAEGVEEYSLYESEGSTAYSPMGNSREYEALKEWTLFRFGNDFSLDARDLLDPTDFHRRIYGAGYGVLADALDAIAEKYDLHLWRHEVVMQTEQEMFDMLGLEPFYPVAEDDSRTIAVYDDGAFRASGLSLAMPDGETVLSVGVTRAMRGTLSNFWILGSAPEATEFETYATQSEVRVDLALGETYSLLFADLENCWVTVDIYGGYAPVNEAALLSLADLEAVAESIQFKALDSFDAAAIGEKVEAESTQYLEQFNESQIHQPVTRSQKVFDELGNYDLTGLVDGYRFYMSGAMPAESSLDTWIVLEETGGCFESVYLTYETVENAQTATNIYLRYDRFWTDETKTTLNNEGAFFRDMTGSDLMYHPEEVADCTVGGFPGYCGILEYNLEGYVAPCNGVLWYDIDKELIFFLNTPGTLTMEQTLDLAGRFAQSIAS